MRQVTFVLIPSRSSESLGNIVDDGTDSSHPAGMDELDVYPLLTPNG